MCPPLVAWSFQFYLRTNMKYDQHLFRALREKAKTAPLNMNTTIDFNLIPFAWGMHDRCNALCNAPRADTHERESKLGLVSTRSWLEVWSSFHLHRYRKDSNASMDALLVRLCIHFLNASNAREEKDMSLPEASLSFTTQKLGLGCPLS